MRGDARLYRLSPPLFYSWRGVDSEEEDIEFVVSSAIVMFSDQHDRNLIEYHGMETMIFAADYSGCIKSFIELAVAKNTLDPKKCFEKLGYLEVKR